MDCSRITAGVRRLWFSLARTIPQKPWDQASNSDWDDNVSSSAPASAVQSARAFINQGWQHSEEAVGFDLVLDGI